MLHTNLLRVRFPRNKPGKRRLSQRALAMGIGIMAILFAVAIVAAVRFIGALLADALF